MYANANKHNRSYEHVSPLKKTCGISPLEHQASGILDKYFLLKYSLPLEISLSRWGSLSPWEGDTLSKMISFDVISLSPFDINFQEGLLEFVVNGFDPWVTAQSIYKNVMLVEDKIHWVELDQKKHRISGKLFFLLWNRWHRVVCFGCTERIWLDRKQQIGETEFIAEKTLVTSAH